MQIYRAHIRFGWFLFVLCGFFVQSKPNADNDKHEGEKYAHEQRNVGWQDKKQKSRTRQHKAESQGKAQISIISLKWVL